MPLSLFLMAKAQTLRAAFLSVFAFAAIATVPAHAEAAGTIIIEQISPMDQYGSWRLATPAGMTVNRKKDQVKSINAVEGQYLLNVEPPRGAVTTMRFYDGGTLLNTTEGTQISFIFSGNGTLRAEISYRYEGVIIIESSPPGAHFELKGPQGVRKTGITPATFTQMPPLYFTASYSPLPGCLQPKPQGRILRPNAELRFQADYVCLNDIKTMNNTPPPAGVPTPEAMTPATKRMLDEQSRANVQLFHTINQQETVAGSIVYITLGVRNVSKTTLNNVILSEQFDLTKLSLPGALPGGGINRGNTAIWEIPQILAGQSFSVQFPVKTSAEMQEGEQVALTARIAGSDVHAPSGELLTKVVRVGIVPLPATGKTIELMFLLLIGALSAIITSNPINRRKPIVETTVFKQ